MSNVDVDQGEDVTAEPVPGFGKYRWRSGAWQRIFDRQIGSIKDELARAHAEDRAVVYLSCPISSRGGGYSRTNAEVAHFTARRLMHRWGERLFVLNPAEYQMESREGTGRILQHVRQEWPDIEDPEKFLKQLSDEHTPGGGDYMRMWVKVLVEDERYPDEPGVEHPRRGLNCGGMFDAYYFLGPSDVQRFFMSDDDASLTQVVESYFTRKYATDLDFRREFDSPASAEAAWERRRKVFFRYYALRASASWSLGSHDEWNVMVRINGARRRTPAYKPGEELACYFDGRQVSPAAASSVVAPGYEVPPPSTEASEASRWDPGRSAPTEPSREIAWPDDMSLPVA